MHSHEELVEGHRRIQPPAGVPVLDVDPYDPGILTAPESFYADLRAQGPFAYIPRYSILACGRYSETLEIFSDNVRFVSSRGVGLQDFAVEEPWRPPSLLLEADPPDHTVVRKVMNRALSARNINAMKTRFANAADTLVDALIERDEFDAVGDLAEAFTTDVFPTAVGMRERNPEYLIEYGAMVFNGIGPDNAIRQTSMAHAERIVPWITDACTRDQLDDDGIGAAIHDAVDAGKISSHQAQMLVRSLFSAGVDTTIAGIASALWCLGNHPTDFQALRDDPALSRQCFDEVLRFSSPAHSFSRTANSDTTVSGIDIVEGSKILCMIGAANLDENQWENASRFDIHRRPGGHLAFGGGIHRCVGQTLARAEVDALLSAIARKVQHIELRAPATWRPGNGIHGIARLPMTFS